MAEDDRLTLILGGARSGKSRLAETMAAESGESVVYVATAEALDEEMAARIKEHRANRPADWNTIEAPQGVGAAVRERAGKPDFVLLDCITLLANNLFGREVRDDPEVPHGAEMQLMAEIESILEAYEAVGGQWAVVSNEVGLGLVPPYPLGRAYRDALGLANQRLAEAADGVVLMVAGQPLWIKGNPGSES